ncbi:MAG: FxsA family protein [Pseudomonadota bacterium]
MEFARKPAYVAAMRLSYLPLLLLIIPVVEISIFITVGQHIGVLWTVVSIILTACTGAFLLRFQGFRVFGELNRQMQAGGLPTRALGDAALIVVAALLLVTPGFLTDALGFSLFVPAVRRFIWAFIAKRITVVGPRTGAGMGAGVSFGGTQFGGGGPDQYPGSSNGPSHGPSNDSPAGAGPTIDLDADDYEERAGGKPKPGGPSPWKGQ